MLSSEYFGLSDHNLKYLAVKTNGKENIDYEMSVIDNQLNYCKTLNSQKTDKKIYDKIANKFPGVSVPYDRGEIYQDTNINTPKNHNTQNLHDQPNQDCSEQSQENSLESDESFCDCEDCREHNFKMQQFDEAKRLLIGSNEESKMYEIYNKNHCSQCDIFISNTDNLNYES